VSRKPRPERDAALEPTELGQIALAEALAKGAQDPVMLQVAEQAGYADLFLVVSGRSERQVKAIAEAVRQGLAEKGRLPLGSEGFKHGQWALIDFGELVVHVFHESARQEYDLEGLWIDAPRVEL